MALPETIRFSVDKFVGEYCALKVPPHARHQVKVEYDVRENTVTIFERRAPWREVYGPDWTKLKIAQMRYDPESKTWSMWWADRNGRWLFYRHFTPSPDIRDCLFTSTTTKLELSGARPKMRQIRLRGISYLEAG